MTGIAAAAGNYLFASLMPLSHIAGYLAAAIGLVCAAGRFRTLRAEPIFYCMGLFVVYGCCRSLFSADPAVGYAAMAGYFGHWLAPFLLGFCLRGAPPARRVYWIFGAVFTGIIFFSVLAYFGLFYTHFGAYNLVAQGLLKGFRSHITLAAIALLLSFLAVSQAIERKDFAVPQRLAFFGLALFFLGAVFLTGSRAYYLAALIAYPAFGIRWAVRTRRWLACAAALLLAAGVVVLLYQTTPYLQARIQKTDLADANVNERLILYRVALQEIADRPIFGFGPGQGILQSAYFDRLPPREQGVRVHHHLHSFYLNLAADFGLIGLALFGCMAWLLLSRILPLLRQKDYFVRALGSGVFWGMVAILLGDCFDTMLRGPGVAMELFWLAGLAAGFASPDRERSS